GTVHANSCGWIGLDADRRGAGFRGGQGRRPARPRDVEDDGFVARHGNAQTARHASGDAAAGNQRPRESRAGENPCAEKKGDAQVKLLKSAAGLLGLLAVLGAAPASAQSAPRGETLAQSDNDALERWQRMSPEQKQELRERFQRWKNLPPAEKEELQKKLETWRRLPPEEKAQAQHNFERWQKLTPEQRERLQERWRQWRELLRQRFEKLREMPPEKRQQLREKLEEWRRSSPEEKAQAREKMRERFERLPPREKQE